MQDSGLKTEHSHSRYSEYGLLFLIAVVYFILIGKYRAFDIDDTWFPSFSYNFWVRHICVDTFMLKSFPDGMGGVRAFGKLAAITQGFILSCLGWTLRNSIMISASFVVGALVLLADVTRRFNRSTHINLCLIALLGLSEPVVVMAQKARYEFLVFFLLAVALWLAVRRLTIPAVFIAVMAVEIEPAAIVVPIAIMTVILTQAHRQGEVRKQLIRITFAGICAGAVYLAMHPHIFSIIRSAHWDAVSDRAYPGGFVMYYYFHFKRHLPDFVLLIVACFVASVYRRHLFMQWPALCVLVIAIASALLRWDNAAYFGLISPFLCLFVIQALYVERYWKFILAAILLWMLPQYAYRYHFWSKQNAEFSQLEQQKVGNVIEQIARLQGTSPSQLSLMGSYTLWYAHPDHFVNLDKSTLKAYRGGRVIFLCFDKAIDPILPPETNSEVTCSQLDGFSKKVESMELHGHTLEVRLPVQ